MFNSGHILNCDHLVIHTHMYMHIHTYEGGLYVFILKFINVIDLIHLLSHL